MSENWEEEFRTRWRRWLAQKCRIDRDGWATLLDSNWRHWPTSVLEERAVDCSKYYSPFLSRQDIIELFSEALDVCTLDEMYKLDNIYCEMQIEQ